MKSAKKILSAILFVSILFLSSCSEKWTGFENQDLSKYIELGEFPSFELSDYQPSEEEISEAYKSIIEEHSTKTISENATRENNQVKIVQYIIVNGESEPLENIESELINNSDIRYNYLIGKKSGDTVSIVVDNPSFFGLSYSTDDTVEIKINIIAVYVLVPPELNEDFFNSVRKGCKNEGELKEILRSEIKEAKDYDNNLTSFYTAWNTYAESAKYLQTPYEEYIGHYNDLKATYETLASTAGLELYDYVQKNCDMSTVEFEEILKNKSLEMTKNSLLIFATAKEKGISVTENDLLEYADKIASESNGEFESGDDVLNYYGEDTLKEDLIFSIIIENSIGK